MISRSVCLFVAREPDDNLSCYPGQALTRSALPHILRWEAPATMKPARRRAPAQNSPSAFPPARLGNGAPPHRGSDLLLEACEVHDLLFGGVDGQGVRRLWRLDQEPLVALPRQQRHARAVLRGGEAADVAQGAEEGGVGAEGAEALRGVLGAELRFLQAHVRPQHAAPQGAAPAGARGGGHGPLEAGGARPAVLHLTLQEPSQGGRLPRDAPEAQLVLPHLLLQAPHAPERPQGVDRLAGSEGADLQGVRQLLERNGLVPPVHAAQPDVHVQRYGVSRMTLGDDCVQLCAKLRRHA
mmetsp:Transcript_19104/g.53740  ORF Transcript_19104/g.53740 Transcript_19104/m.53740 type:complete len:297 (+) Transcript_19104:181-1071(+)